MIRNISLQGIIDELRQSALEKQEAAKIIRAIAALPGLADVFDKATERTRCVADLLAALDTVPQPTPHADDDVDGTDPEIMGG